MALGVMYNGAAGRTEAALRQALGLDGLTSDEVNRSLHGLIRMLRGLDPRVRFFLGTSVWCRQGVTFTRSFLDAARTWFDAPAEALDFRDPEAARIINEWVRRATEGHITEIVSSPLPPLAWMYLLNAIYFKGDWTAQFEPALTRTERFWRADGSATRVSMMSRPTSIGLYVELGGDPLLLDVPYGGRAFSMAIAVPREPAGIHSVMDQLTAERWDAWMARLRPDNCDVRLPKFRLESELVLNQALRALGLGIAFGSSAPDKADFGRLRPEGDLYLDEVRHKSSVDVNEEGTVAAAATSLTYLGSIEPARLVVVDRPFLFAIRENISGTILFLGRVLDPAAG